MSAVMSNRTIYCTFVHITFTVGTGDATSRRITKQMREVKI